MKWRSWWLFPPAEREAATKRSAPNKKESIRCAPFFLPKFGLWYYYCRWWPMALMKLDQSQKQVAHWAFFFSGKKKNIPLFLWFVRANTFHTGGMKGEKRKGKEEEIQIADDCFCSRHRLHPSQRPIGASLFEYSFRSEKILLKVTQRTPEKRDVQLRASRLCSFD